MATIRCKSYQFHRIEAVIFDKDGTLANCEEFLRSLAQCRSRLLDAQVPGIEAPLLMAFGVEGDRINPAGLMAVGTRLENEIAAAAYIAETGKSWAESLQIARSGFLEADQYMANKTKHTGVIEGALDLIQCLAAAEVKLAILSADSTSSVEAFVETWLPDAFQVVYGVNETYPAKSDPGLLQQLFADLEVQPQHSLMIGDSSLDLQIAQAADLTGFIGFSGGWSSNVAISGAEVVVDRFEQIRVEPPT